jgi:hypothetical protein
MTEPLGFPKEALERGQHFVDAEAVEIEMSLHGELASLQASEIPETFRARSALDPFAGGEGIDFAPAVHEIVERGERLALLVASVRKGEGGRKAQLLLAPSERPYAAHLQVERLLIRNLRRESRERR